MKSAERQVLHGLYFHRQMVGEEMPYSAGEIAWLEATPIPKTREWLKEGKLQSIEKPGENYLASVGSTSAAATRVLSFLSSAGLLEYRKEANLLRVLVTYKGAKMARQLDTRLGRLNLLYLEHKGGVLWFVATVLVSLVTALATGRGQ